MKLNAAIFFAMVFLLAAADYAAADVIDIYLSVPKAIYGPGEQVELYGGIYNVTNGTASYSGISGAAISIYIINNSGSIVSNYTINTSSGGTFYSKNDYNANGTLILAPNATGNYTVRATYNAGATAHNSSATITIVSRTVDEVRIRTDSPVYYSSSAMEITVEAARVSGDYRLPVANITINGTVRDSGESVLSSFNCITDSNGKCTISKTSPSSAGNYFVEANNFIGYTTFKVVPFEVDVYIKDDTGETLKTTFYPGQSGYVEVRASYNGSNPSGDFTATGNIYDSNGTLIASISSFSLTSNNSYVNKASFTVGSVASAGTYVARVVVSKTGAGSVNGSASYQVKQWELSSSKTGTSDGFESGYTAFGNTTVYFKADVMDLANGTSITGLESNFTVLLKNHLGDPVANTTVRYNSTLDDYLFNITLPSVVGKYTLSVSVNYGGQTQTVTKAITITGSSATVTPTDADGKKKEIFTISEFVYLKVAAKNATKSTNVTDAEIISITYEDGTRLSYTSTANCGSINITDSNSQWCWNASTGMIKLDPPKKGGLFTAEVYANNRSISAAGRFAIKPYSICVSTKASENVNQGSDYYWQFKTSDNVYFLITLAYTQDTTGMTTSSSGNGSSGGGGMSMGASYGMGSGCSVGATESAVENATIAILKVVNVQSGKTETLNATTSICKSTTVGNKAAYICTLQASDNRWDGGRYYAVLDITGPDSETTDKGYGMFEARSFYLYGWSNSWQNKPASNITFNLYMYSGGSGWFSQTKSGGMSGTVTLEKIKYMGSGWGDWITPVDYDYNTQGMSAVTITNGIGNLTLNATRAPGGRWRSGMYSAVIKGTDTSSGDIDYGEIWFEIRNWYAWAQAVEVTSWPYQYKWQINTRENASLYVKISNAGDMWSSSGNSLGGNVTIRVKKIEYYTTWPPKELPQANYTSNTITVNASSCDIWSSCSLDASKYVINISPVSGRWQSGYYNVVLDINGSETGWGGFNALAFYVGTQPVDINGTYAYISKGNGPVYINVTATKSQKYYYSYYSGADYINTTFDRLTLHRWDSSGGNWRQVDLKYPQDINVNIVGRSDLNLTGIAIINITYNSSSGKWPTGYYYGEIILSNNESDTATGWIWFSIEPFRVDLQASQYEIAQDENVTAAMNIYEPGWSASTPLPGNYTITQVVQRTWTYAGETVTQLNYTPHAFNGSNATLNVLPPNGTWSNGWKSLTITVNDTVSGATKEGWLSFRVVPFKISVSRNSYASIGISNNLTIIVNLTNPKTGAPVRGNLSEVYKWGWPSKTYYDFYTGNCRSAVSGSCTINGSANVTITPHGEWDEGYQYVQFTFTTTTNPAPLEDWSSIGFEARQAVSGYMYAADDNGNYLWAAANTSNITMFLYSLQDMNWNSAAVNVTGVQYYRSEGYWVEERSRTYGSIASWSVINITTGQATGSNEISGSGYIRLNPPGGTWANGEYYIKISVRKANGDVGIIKNGWFRIKDMTPVLITVNSPSNNSVINASYIVFNATTSKKATCSVNIMSNGSTYYYAYLSQYGGYGGNTSAITGDAIHIFNQSTSGMSSQAYIATFYCNDYDYNYASALVSFTLNVTGGGNSSSEANSTILPYVASVSLSPSSPTNSSTLRCNATVLNATASSVAINVTWYRNQTVFSQPYVGTILNGTNAEVSNVSASNLSVGDVWMCSVRATNNYANYSAWMNSSNVTISGQSAPWPTTVNKNSTAAGNSTLFYTYWHDALNLSGYIFSFDNGQGTFTNDSWMPFTGTDNWSNVTKTLNSTGNATIKWRVYANNSGNLWNSTNLIVFNTTI